MKVGDIRWSPDKDAEIRANPLRGNIGLAECATAIEEGRILADIANPTRSNQRLYVLEINGYAYVVPYVYDNNAIFLKTMFPSRKHNARYLGAGQ